MKSTVKTDELYNNLTSNFDRIDDMIREIQTSTTRSSIYSASDVIRMLDDIKNSNRTHIDSVIQQDIEQYLNDVDGDYSGGSASIPLKFFYELEVIIENLISKAMEEFKPAILAILDDCSEDVDLSDYCTLDTDEYGGEITVRVSCDSDDAIDYIKKNIHARFNDLDLSDIEYSLQEHVKKQISEDVATTKSQDNQ